jgi:hypothetical protein
VKSNDWPGVADALEIEFCKRTTTGVPAGTTTVSVLEKRPFDPVSVPFAASADCIEELHPEIAISAASNVVRKTTFIFIGIKLLSGLCTYELSN